MRPRSLSPSGPSALLRTGRGNVAQLDGESTHRPSGTDEHPALTEVGKAAVAAALGWQVGSLLPPPLGHYAYYAVLGAITVLYPTVRDTARQALAATGGVLCGVLLAVGIQSLSWHNAVTLAVAVGLGTAIGRLGIFGDQRSWVTIAALFVLTASAPNTETFVLGYVTQVPLGAAIGLAVNYLVLPPLPLAALAQATQRMRTLLTEQLTVTVRLLRDDARVDQDSWRAELRDLEPVRAQVRKARRQADRARTANLRRMHWSDTSGTLERQALALERCSWLIEDLSLMMVEFQHRDTSAVLGDELRVRAIASFEALSSLLEQAPGPSGSDADARKAADAAIQDLLVCVDHTDFADRETRYIAGAMALATLRCARTFTHRSAV